jgi:hypothetical protein
MKRYESLLMSALKFISTKINKMAVIDKNIALLNRNPVFIIEASLADCWDAGLNTLRLDKRLPASKHIVALKNNKETISA